MKRIYLLGLILILAISALSAGCGGGGDGGPDPNAPAAVTVTISKNLALADGADAVVVQADVKKADGSAVPDGTVVTFSAPGSAGALTPTTAICSSGTASVTLTHPPLSTDNELVIVTAAAGGVSGNKAMQFINQPTSVEVSVAVNKTVANVALLQFNLKNTPGATFNNTDPQRIFAINEAAGSLVTGNFLATANSSTIGLVNPSGFNTVAATPIIRATYDVAAGAGLPTFSIDTIASIVAKDPQFSVIAPQLSAADMVITTTYNTEL